MDPIIEAIRQEFAAHADPEICEKSQRFFKEEVRCYGMKTATGIAIAKKYWKEVKTREKEEIFALCEELYSSGMMEEAFVVSEWAPRLADRYEPGDIAVFRHWIEPTSPTGPPATASATTPSGTSLCGTRRRSRN